MITALLAAGIASAVAIFCIGHKVGYRSAVADWHMKERRRPCEERQM